MLKLIHDGHLGIDRCKRRAREVLFWPGITKDIESYIKKCKVCQENANKPSREPMIPVSIPNLPWNKIGTDLFEYGKKSYLILVDYFSGFVEVSHLRDTTAYSVVLAMKENFARYGIPDKVISDNGPQFSCQKFKKFAHEWGFIHITSSPYYAQSNGKSERAVQTVKKMLKKSIDSKTDFHLNLLSYRNTPRENLDSPARLMMGRRLNCRLPVHPDLLKQNNDCNKQHQNLQDKQKKSKLYYDQHSKALPELNVGDDVIMCENNNKRIRGTIVGKAPTPRSYIVKNRLGIYRRNRRHLIKSMPVSEPVESKVSSPIVLSDEYESGEDDDEYEASRTLGDSFDYSPPVTRSKCNN